MSNKFDGFVLFAEMRTGSNHLEESLNQISDVASFGEAFNPAFMGAHNKTELFGIDMAARAADPMPLLDAILGQEGISGFRYFHNHDPRVLDRVLEDTRIAKVILTRNPLDSYISLSIAAKTGQWRLTNPKMAKAAKARFNGAEFDALLDAKRTFRERIAHALKVTGQSAYWIAYEDIGDLEVLNGLATFLGASDRLKEVPGRLKRQNPGELEDKVENADEMRAHLRGLDPFALDRAVQMDPPRGPSIPSLMAAAASPLLALPVPGGPNDAVRDWLTALDGAAPSDGMTQKELRPWMRSNKDFISFAILRHPLARAHDAWQVVLNRKGPKANNRRRILTNQHGVVMEPSAEGFLSFLRFLKAGLGGQSALPVAPKWATQTALLAGMAQAVLPQRLIREPEAQAELDWLGEWAGRPPQPFNLPGLDGLNAVVSEDIEDACIAAYRRDFLQFGFRRWKNS